MINPLRADPTRTTLLRNKFAAEAVRRFNTLKAKINQLLIGEDSLGLTSNYLKPHVKYGYDKNRDHAVDRGYTYQWHKARKEYFELKPWCVQCAKEGKKVRATNLDHIKKHGGNQTIFWDKGNWQGLCASCHSKKTRTNNELTLHESWQFHTQPQQVELFRQWLQQQLSHVVKGQHNDNDWWNEYILQGYARGAGRAFADTKRSGKLGSFYRGTQEEFLQSTFAQPVSTDKLKLLTGRVFTDLRGITDTLSQQITRVLADGLVMGKSPREIAVDMNDRVDKIGATRSAALARTEIIRAHAEGQLDAFERMGVEELGVAVEWSTSGLPNVCPKCKSLQGIVLKASESHGLLPRHPNCRCSWIPSGVGEDTSGQIKTKIRIQAAIRLSVGKDKKDKWLGKDLEVSKARPEALV